MILKVYMYIYSELVDFIHLIYIVIKFWNNNYYIPLNHFIWNVMFYKRLNIIKTGLQSITLKVG